MKTTAVPSNEEKSAVWRAYHERRPTRVPLTWGVNTRVLLLNPDWNPEGYDFETYFHDPQVSLVVQARFAELVATEFGRVSDGSTDLPEQWSFGVESQNIYDAAYFGADVQFRPGQVPATESFLTIDEVDDFLARDFSKPLENPWVRERLAFREALVREAEGFEYLGRKGSVGAFGVGFDGPLTVATNLFGSDIFLLLRMDPEKAVAVMRKISEAALLRTAALGRLADPNWQLASWGGLADDSVQLIDTALYEDLILPLHAWWYDNSSTSRPADNCRGVHLCGDATHHFPMLRRRLGVISFDTGFPVDHGALRRELGADVEISGGPHVSILKNSSPDDCFRAARDILQSGVMEGGRFILREANNLPPCVPMENLAAVYEACIEFGRYEHQTPWLKENAPEYLAPPAELPSEPVAEAQTSDA